MALVYFTDEWEKLYNCTFYNYQSRPIEERLNPLRGWIYIITFCFVWVSYQGKRVCEIVEPINQNFENYM